MIALVDESMLLLGHGGYTLACVVLQDERRAVVRGRLRRLTRSRRQFHWVREEPSDRFRMLQLLTAEASSLTAYTHRPAVRRDHPATRAALLRTLVTDLDGNLVSELLVESRDPRNDARDRQVIATAMADAELTGLAYGHARPEDEPLLWLADTLAGAVSAHVRGDRQYTAALPAERLVMRRL